MAIASRRNSRGCSTRSSRWRQCRSAMPGVRCSAWLCSVPAICVPGRRLDNGTGLAYDGRMNSALTPAELRSLSGRSNAEGAVRTGIHVVLLAGSGWLLAMSGPWTLLPALIAFGLVQVALFAPAHEATHQTAFASRRANRIVGWLAACPSLLNLEFYTAFHFAHHRHTQIPGRDPELDMAAPHDVASYVRRVLGVPFWRLR